MERKPGYGTFNAPARLVQRSPRLKQAFASQRPCLADSPECVSIYRQAQPSAECRVGQRSRIFDQPDLPDRGIVQGTGLGPERANFLPRAEVRKTRPRDTSLQPPPNQNPT